MDKDKKENRKTSMPRLIINDATIEKLGELLQENPRGLLLVRDEFAGFFAKMENKDYERPCFLFRNF
ncbi:hypothetical protein GCM10023261_05280 [Bartonella jaculi]|uniref:Uncharacterized protein n=1 Tax=Bartonella jaculi TaxID=686226 RepID=A0ABP9N2D6_9HYPH